MCTAIRDMRQMTAVPGLHGLPGASDTQEHFQTAHLKVLQRRPPVPTAQLAGARAVTMMRGRRGRAAVAATAAAAVAAAQARCRHRPTARHRPAASCRCRHRRWGGRMLGRLPRPQHRGDLAQPGHPGHVRLRSLVGIRAPRHGGQPAGAAPCRPDGFRRGEVLLRLDGTPRQG